MIAFRRAETKYTDLVGEFVWNGVLFYLRRENCLYYYRPAKIQSAKWRLVATTLAQKDMAFAPDFRKALHQATIRSQMRRAA